MSRTKQTKGPNSRKRGSGSNSSPRTAPKFPPKPIVFWGIACVVAGTVVPFGLHATLQDPAAVVITNDLKAMSPTDRALLESSRDRFENLPGEKQNSYRELHRFVAIDRAKSGPYSTVFEEYLAWTAKLSFTEWDRVKGTEDPAARIAAVTEVVSERAARRAELDRVLAAPLTGGSPNRSELSRVEIDRLVGVFESQLGPETRPPDDLIGPLRWLNVLSTYFSRQRDRGGRSRFGIDSRLLPDLIAALDEGSAYRRRLESMGQVEQRMFLTRLVFVSVQGELRREIEARAPADEDLRAFFLTLPEQSREELLKMKSPSEAKRILAYRFVSSLDSDEGRALREYLDMLRRMSSRPGGPGGPQRSDRDRIQDGRRPSQRPDFRNRDNP